MTGGADISSITNHWVLVNTAYFNAESQRFGVQEIYPLGNVDSSKKIFKRMMSSNVLGDFENQIIVEKSTVYSNITTTYLDVEINGILISAYNSNLSANATAITHFARNGNGKYRIYFDKAPTNPIQISFMYK